MNRENQSFHNKGEDELRAQLDSAEKHLGERLVPENEREEALSLPVSELKKRYPEEYVKYLNQLRIGGQQVEVGENPAVQNYTDAEVNEVRDAMAGKAPLSNATMDKLNKDENVKRYSMAVFFPLIRDRIVAGESPEVFVLPTQGRRTGLKVAFADQAFAVKTLENSKELEIANIAEELKVGPKQFESIPNHLTEEFIEGSLIAKLDAKTCTLEFMENLGRQIGEGIKKMHGRNIVLNDQLLRDDFGKCHTIVSESGEARFIDFGAAVDLSDYPNLTEEQFWLLMRSDGWASMGMHGLSGDELTAAVKRYGENLVSQFPNKESLMMARDYGLINEGLGFISYHLPNVDSLARGIREVLKF